MSIPDDPTPFEDLRRRAEHALEGQSGLPETYPDDPRALILELQRQQHELQVHQIELQLQMGQLVETNLALEQARAEYQDLFDLAPIGYLTLDPGGQILRANFTAAGQLGVPREVLLRRRFSAFVDPAGVSALTLFLRRVFASPGRRTLDLRLLRPDGGGFYAQVEALSGGEEEGAAPRECRLAIIDITPQREAQEEVLRLNQTLEERVEARTAHIRELGEELETFVYAVTHDLLTPLRHIRSFSGLLVAEKGKGELDAEAQARYARHVLQAVGRMELLLQTLLGFFRTGRQRIRFGRVDLGRVLAEVHKDLRADLEGREVVLTHDPLPVVTGDSTTLQVVFTNLLTNALKFSRDRAPARIHIGTQDTAREHLIWVRDNGVGFNMRQKGRLFGMFQRLHSDREFEGTGVGLALVRRIVLRHGGRVWAEGTPGQGATFWISLPKQPPLLDDALNAPPPSDSPGAAPSPRRVVVIGGSAGALNALLEIARHLPGDFPAAVLVAVHVSPDYPSRLPQLLNDAGPLEARHAADGEPLRAGCIRVAPPDYHLLVVGEHLRLSHGPRENRSRPSIDVLFRSAASSCGPNALGVLLSGMLDDGTSGLWTIKRLGGQGIVQHPEEAPYPSMPLSAVQQVEVDDILPARAIGPRMLAWARQPGRGEDHPAMTDHDRQRLDIELGVAAEDNAFEGGVLNLGPLVPFTCPECHGVMVKIQEGAGIRFRCHTGHAFSPVALLSELRESVEAALWTSVRALDENVMLLDHLRKHLGEAGQPAAAEVFGQEATEVKESNRTLREFALQMGRRGAEDLARLAPREEDALD